MPEFTFPLDDAYITLHNARVLLTGFDPNYRVSPLIGATSPAHLALVALFGLAVPLPAASLIANLCALLAYIGGLWRLALLVQPLRWVAIAVVALGIGAAHAPYHLLNGLETGFAMAVVVWAFVLGIERSPNALPLLCGLMPFIRPELSLLSGVLLLWRAWQDPEFILRDISLATLAAAPFAIWMWRETNWLLPNTAIAKKAFFAEGGASLAWRLQVALSVIKQSWVGLPIILSILLKGSPLAWPARGFVLMSLLAFVITFPGGLAHNWFRYLYIFLPVGLLFLSNASQDPMFRRTVLPALLIGYAIVGIYSWPTVTEGREFSRRQLVAMEWVRNQMPSSARILVHDAGFAAWATPFRLIDAVGLKTPKSVAAHQRWTTPTLGRDRYKALAAIAAEYRPTHAIILNDTYWGGIANDLRRAGWILDAIREPEGRGYVIYELRLPDEAGLGVHFSQVDSMYLDTAESNLIAHGSM